MIFVYLRLLVYLQEQFEMPDVVRGRLRWGGGVGRGQGLCAPGVRPPVHIQWVAFEA